MKYGVMNNALLSAQSSTSFQRPLSHIRYINWAHQGYLGKMLFPSIQESFSNINPSKTSPIYSQQRLLSHCLRH